MTSSDKSELIEKSFKRWVYNQGITLSSVQIGLLSDYLAELVKWNSKINLTGLRSRERIVHELLLDSLLPIPYLPVRGRILDVGSGAGFPSIPLRICSSGPVFHLVEPILKKTNFLKQVIRLTGLKDIEVFRGRLEDLDGDSAREGYDAVLSRGLSLGPQILAGCAASLVPGGLFFTFQGSGGRSDREELAGEAQKQGLSPWKSIPYTVPGVPVAATTGYFQERALIRHEKTISACLSPWYPRRSNRP